MDFKQSATEICDAIVTASGGPLMSKADAVTYVEKFLREMWRQAEERGRRDYHNQLSDAMYPRSRD